MSPGSLLDGDSGINLSIETDSRTAGKKQDHTSNRQFGIFILNFFTFRFASTSDPNILCKQSPLNL